MSAKSDVQNIENKQNKNGLELTQSIIKEALDKLGYAEDTYELLKDSLRIFKVRIPVRMDDGGVEYFSVYGAEHSELAGLIYVTAYSAEHNDAVAHTKGGVRFHPNVNESDINSLAIWMSLKAGIVDLPYGGAKGGIICDPREMSFRELEGLSRGYVRALN